MASQQMSDQRQVHHRGPFAELSLAERKVWLNDFEDRLGQANHLALTGSARDWQTAQQALDLTRDWLCGAEGLP